MITDFLCFSFLVFHQDTLSSLRTEIILSFSVSPHLRHYQTYSRDSITLELILVVPITKIPLEWHSWSAPNSQSFSLSNSLCLSQVLPPSLPYFDLTSMNFSPRSSAHYLFPFCWHLLHLQRALWNFIIYLYCIYNPINEIGVLRLEIISYP